ncbi:insulin-degrading enzyme-like 1, peroxisomal [Hibiscus syriacus]|uniref:insulin-degrading enzyme-like 1, peroxisomal n=1 Tax=Hibiscus syriacus TaxID=106335 RepID=UPI0019203C8F|nr:insulin-degrading enzyme-like 1, peroxisomal [Hibiscus syriacus]
MLTKSKGSRTRQELLKFYKEKYSANLMHLVAYSKESLDKIQSLAEDKFQEIRNYDRSHFQFPGQPSHPNTFRFLSEPFQ